MTELELRLSKYGAEYDPYRLTRPEINQKLREYRAGIERIKKRCHDHGRGMTEGERQEFEFCAAAIEALNHELARRSGRSDAEVLEGLFITGLSRDILNREKELDDMEENARIQTIMAELENGKLGGKSV